MFLIIKIRIYLPGIIKSLARLKDELNHTRYFTYRIISLWKIILFLLIILFTIWMDGDDPAMFFQLFNTGFGPHNIVIEEVRFKLILELSHDFWCEEKIN